MINFGIRQSFEKIEQIKERFSNLNVPVELALPYYWDIYRLNLGISRDMICTVFRQLQKEKKILCLDKGQSAKWKRTR